MPNGIQIAGKPIISINEEAIGNLRTGSMLGTGIGGGYGFRTIPYYYWVPYTFKPAKTTQELKIIGIKNAYLQPSTSPYGMTLKKFDTASYVDRAILQLKNETAGNVVVRDISIRGEPVYQIAGQNGFIWEYSDYDSIDKNGEQFKEIGNDFIFDASQAESIGDFAWKLLKPHQVYTLALRGCQYQYQIGDVYTLNVNYSLDASSSQIELVNVDVEVIGVSFERSVGSVGSTMLACRVDLGAWSKTTSRRAQLVGTGQANNNTNRTNTVTVASSTYTGTADYYCDGTDDHVEIQRAIDDLYAIGGGTVQLTNGDYEIPTTQYISILDNITLIGVGKSTKIIFNDESQIKIAGTGGTIKKIYFYSATPYGPTYTADIITDTGGGYFSIESCFIESINVSVSNNGQILGCNLNGTSSVKLLGKSSCISCIFNTSNSAPIYITTSGDNVVSSNIIDSDSFFISGIYSYNCDNNIISNNKIKTTTNPFATFNAYGIHIESSDNCVVSSNNIYGILNSGTGTGYGIRIDSSDRTNVSGNTSLGCESNYSNAGTNTTATGNIFA